MPGFYNFLGSKKQPCRQGVREQSLSCAFFLFTGGEMIAHHNEQQKLIDNIARRQHTLLTGDIGVGKTHILEQVPSQVSDVIYIQSPSLFKSVLLEILRRLHANGDLEIPEQDVEYLSESELLKKLNRLNISELLSIVINNLSGRDYILLLDHLEQLIPF